MTLATTTTSTADDSSAVVEGTAVRDGAGSSSRPSSGGSPVATSLHMLELCKALEQPFTIGTMVRAAERDGILVSRALRWLREAEGTVVTDIGTRQLSANALRGARLYRVS